MLDDAAPDSTCSAPVWQRSPVRVSFEAPGNDKQTFTVRGHVAELVNDAEEDEEGEQIKLQIVDLRFQIATLLATVAAASCFSI